MVTFTHKPYIFNEIAYKDFIAIKILHECVEEIICIKNLKYKLNACNHHKFNNLKSNREQIFLSQGVWFNIKLKDNNQDFTILF